MDFLIISGMSGAGKSRAADILEDLDFYCVDNMPVALLPRFAELCLATRGRYERVALVTDVRERDSFDGLFDVIDRLREQGIRCRILFIEADTPTLVKRFKETRRPHPLQSEGVSVEESIARERRILEPLRIRADYVVNTAGLTTAMLKSRIMELFPSAGRRELLSVNITAFGYKYGLPMDSDIVLDVRMLPNPFYVEELRALSGLDAPVRDYIFSFDEASAFMDKLCDLLRFLLPLYMEDGRYCLNIAVGCTGGRHRSVAITRALGDSLEGVRGVTVTCGYRDIDRN